MAKEVKGDLLDRKGYIVHQCNCISNEVTPNNGLAYHIFKKFPYANIYDAKIKRYPGTILIKGCVVNFLSQEYPGYSDTKKFKREEWFKQCLDKLLDETDGLAYPFDINFPYKIGCGLAGGNWEKYRSMIDEFAKGYDGDVFIVKRDQD